MTLDIVKRERPISQVQICKSLRLSFVPLLSEIRWVDNYKMLHCLLKIVCYLFLLGYHGLDLCFDWKQYYEIQNQHLFVGSHYVNSIIRDVFFTSCCIGSFLAVFMVGLYGCYIVFHIKCLVHRCGGYKQTQCKLDDDVYAVDLLIRVPECKDENCNKHCNRRYASAELILSLLEFALKDLPHSILLMIVINADSSPSCPDIPSIIFTVCTMLAHLKHSVCFLAKVCGLGTGELGCHDSSVKVFSCLVGLVGSIVLLILNLIFVYKLWSSCNSVDGDLRQNLPTSSSQLGF